MTATYHASVFTADMKTITSIIAPAPHCVAPFVPSLLQSDLHRRRNRTRPGIPSSGIPTTRLFFAPVDMVLAVVLWVISLVVAFPCIYEICLAGPRAHMTEGVLQF